MLWALNLSIVTILRSFICLLINDLPLFVLIPMEYLMVTFTIGNHCESLFTFKLN